MKKIRDEVFYRVDRGVRVGDEFYVFVMRHHSAPIDLAFEVVSFHGKGGTPPKSPERSQSFDSQETAEDKFNEWVAAIESVGFSRHNPIIHGVNNFPEVR